MTATTTIGLMRHKALFQTNTPVTLGAGQKDAYSTLLTTRGYLEDLSGGRILQAGELLISNRWRFTTRYSAALAAGLNSQVRLVINGRNYTVDTFRKVGQREFYYEIMLKETE